MAIKTRVEPLDRDIALILKDDLSPSARSEALASFAREQFDEASNVNRQVLGRVPRHETFVDSRRDDRLESVRPDGTIVFEFELLEDMIRWISEALKANSPVRSGLYRKSHILFADGSEIDPGAALRSAREYVFANAQPYARKIERGLSNQHPDGVYQVVAVLASRRFGNVARIRFTYRTIFGSAKDKNTRQPAIVITV